MCGGIVWVHIQHVKKGCMPKVNNNINLHQKHDSQNTDSNPQSSMETVPSDFIDGDFSEEEDESQPWAKLMPLGPGFVTVGTNGEYICEISCQ